MATEAHGQIDLSTYAGDQFFTVVPEPTSIALAGLSLVGLALGRSRKS